MLRDANAFWEWIARSNPPVEVAVFVEAWLAGLATRSAAAPSVPLEDGLREAALNADGDEVIVYYAARDDEPVDVVDLLWIGSPEELLTFRA